jgi:hypothetical protein
MRGVETVARRYIVHNFNHERFIIAVAASRAARTCYEEALKHRLLLLLLLLFLFFAAVAFMLMAASS